MTVPYLIQIEALEQQTRLANIAPSALLPLNLAAPLLGLSIVTLRHNVTRRPQELPPLTRLGRKIYIRKQDIDEFVAKGRVLPPPPLGKRKGARHE